jgi:hypothetical protein
MLRFKTTFVHDSILLGWLNGEGSGGRAYVTHE